MNPEVLEALARLTETARGGLAAGFLVFLRVGAVMALLPAFGEQVLSVRVRLAVTLAFTVIVLPAIHGRVAPLAVSYGSVAAAAAPEIVAGLALGAALRLFVIALQTAGTMAAQATSLAQFFGGHGVAPQPALSQFLMMGGLALAVTMGLHVRAAQAILLSYDVLPPGAFPDPSALAEWGVGLVAHAFALAFTLSAPFVVAALLYNVALGVINRAMPQLMVILVGAPALVGGGLVLMMLVVPVILKLWLDGFNGLLAAPFSGAP